MTCPNGDGLRQRSIIPLFWCSKNQLREKNYANKHCEVKNKATYQPDDESTAGTI